MLGAQPPDPQHRLTISHSHLSDQSKLHCDGPVVMNILKLYGNSLLCVFGANSRPLGGTLNSPFVSLFGSDYW